MILVDTSVWVDHFRRGSAKLAGRLAGDEVLCHPFIIGELACGDFKARHEILSLLARLPCCEIADHDEVLAFVEMNGLMGSGIGWIDAHLLASAVLGGERLWTLDRRVADIADALDVLVK